MTVYATRGFQVAIATGGTANSAPTNSSGYAALTWTPIGEVEDISEFGDNAEVIRFLAVADGRVRKLKGAADAGQMQLTMGHDPADAGQIALLTASGSAFRHNFRVTLSDRADANDTDGIMYFGGRVMSFTLRSGGANDVTRRVANIEIESAIVNVAPTVVP
jgi:Phage tail tube protein, TTP